MFRRRGRQIRVALSREDTELLQQVVREYLDLLDADPEPGDPVIARLYPSASLDDPAVESAYRELATSDLDQHKRETARRFYLCNGYHLEQHETGGDTWFELTLSDAWVWDVYRPTRFVSQVQVRTFRDVNIEELKHPEKNVDPLGPLTD